MNRLPIRLALLAWCLTAVPAVARQTAAPSTAAAVDDVVVEQLSTVVTFTGAEQVREATERVKVNTVAGLQRAGTISVPYARDQGTAEFRYVRVRKASGTVVETPLDSSIDVAADVTQAAPTFTDLYVKHINVRGLDVGDVVECAYVIRSKSLFPGQFWTDLSFERGVVVRDETIEVSLPAGAHAIVKTTPELATTPTTSGDRVTYRWRSHNDEILADKAFAEFAHRRKDVRADIQVTTFHDWAEVGAAFEKLWRDRAVVTPEIRDKAHSLTKDATTTQEKSEAIYRFVATKIRYVAINMGIGRIRPHSAADVLLAGFGDCKDKHTLLAALLEAEGIDAAAALIGVGLTFDQDVPSPAQFNHVVTVLPRGERAATWLDTTLEVAPYGYLLSSERDAHVLQIGGGRPALVLTTPAAMASRPTWWHQEITGRIDDSGTLTAKVRERFSGDTEFLMRAAFRVLPQARWTEAVGELPLGATYSGTVENVSISDPADTTQAFQIDYDYRAKSFSNWSNGNIYPPAPVSLPARPDEERPAIPLPLGLANEQVASSRIELPATTRPALAKDARGHVILERPEARYEATVSVSGQVVTTERKWTVKTTEVPLADVDAFRSWLADVKASRYNVSLNTMKPWGWNDVATIDWYGGASSSATTVLRDAAAAANRKDYQEAIAALKDLLKREPESDAAWQMLGWAELQSGARERGLDTLNRRAPQSAQASLIKYLCERLVAFGRADDALALWEEGHRQFPDDREIPLYLGEAQFRAGRFSDAIDTLLAERERQQASARYHLLLGRAYLGAKRQDEALAGFRKSAELDSAAFNLNNVAWFLGDAGVSLDAALEFAERAIRIDTSALNAVTLSEAQDQDVIRVSSLAASWDTEGWVLYRRGEDTAAERFLNAAWTLVQDRQIAEHLAALYRRIGNDAEARRFTALAAPSPILGAQDAGADLVKRRTFEFPRPAGAGNGTAEALFMVNREGHVKDVRWIRRDDKLGDVDKALVGLSVGWRPPDSALAQIVRRGVLTCAGTNATCALVLIPAGDVRSVK